MEKSSFYPLRHMTHKENKEKLVEVLMEKGYGFFEACEEAEKILQSLREDKK